MKRKKQAEVIKLMTDQEVTLQLILTQLLLLILSILGSFFLFDTFWSEWKSIFEVTFNEWVWFGVLPGFVVLLIDFILMNTLPKQYYDDGGINNKVFKNRSIPGIIGVTLLVAISEEMLFRGVLHTEYGYWAASLLFALLHFRYLSKIVLLISVLFVSFFIGYMFELTGSLTVTITAHFIIDVVLAMWIRLGDRGESSDSIPSK
ncbi:CPBP family intramembrane glutamic endopeptidase [Halobacillus halophilus]|uniref:CPBP family intramembrane glutamic endopeptidase n=1 Tax=Halobacillus halophilus TaxID=1570 RepID=UPI001CD1F3DB|nr:CPBP family intramembrane glutamic endopeptidase [Halobacillus halophilus]MCA1009499.1 CPBP family intramembrane metalloprotease [Halobacillus halophilus]